MHCIPRPNFFASQELAGKDELISKVLKSMDDGTLRNAICRRGTGSISAIECDHLNFNNEKCNQQNGIYLAYGTGSIIALEFGAIVTL